MNWPSLTRLCFTATILFATCGIGSADDVALFQRTWEMTGTNAEGPIRVVKTIEGNNETVEVYSNKILTQKHHVEFELKAFGPAKVFVWKNGQITQGRERDNACPMEGSSTGSTTRR